MNTTQPEQQVLGAPLTSTDADRRALITQASPSLEQAPEDGLAGTKEAPGFWASAKAGYLRHTTVSQALVAAAALEASSDVSDAYDPTFDYTEHWAANKADYRDLEVHYMAGHFDEVRTVAGWERRAFMLRENDMLDRDLAAGGTLGAVAAFAGAMADPVNLLGIGIMMSGARAATRLGRAGHAAASMGTDGILGAVVMNALDPTYDWKDAVLDIGVSSMLGGTIGVMTRNVSHDSPLIPGHPDNPSLPANIKGDPVHIVKPGQATDEGSAMGQSIGAAAVSPETRARMLATEADTLPAKGTGVGGAIQSVADAGSLLANKIGSLGAGTVFDRMAHYPPYLRGLLTQGLDQFGFLNRAMARGDAAAPEAEAINNVWRQKGLALQEDFKGFLREAQTALGESKFAARLKGAVDDLSVGKVQTNTITREEFFRAVVDLRRSYDTGHVKAEAEIKGRLAAVEGRTAEQVDAIYSVVRKASNSAGEHMDNMFSRAIEKGLVDPEMKGKPYGLPIMFVRGSIMRRRDKFENIIMRLLGDQPQADSDLLQTNASDGLPYVHKGFPATAETPAVPPRTFADIEKDPALYNELLREWNGGQEFNQRELAASAWTDAETRLSRATADVEEVMHGMKLIEKEKRKLTIAAIRQHARQAEAQYHGRKLGHALARVERAEAKVAEIQAKAEDLMGLHAAAKRTVLEEGNRIDAATDKATRNAEHQGDAQDLVDFLVGQKADQLQQRKDGKASGSWQGQRDAVLAQGEISRLNDDMRQARAERDEAALYLAEAKQDLKDASRNQRNAKRWLAATEAEVAKYNRSADEVFLGPGIRERMEVERVRLDDLAEKVRKAEKVRQEAVQLWKDTRSGLGIGRKELRKARSEFRKTGRLVEMLGKRTPKAEYAERLARSLSGLEQYPGGMLMDDVPEIGRLKERRFKWTEELLAEAQTEGFVENDLSYMMDRYTRDMGGRLALHEAFDGRSYASLAEETDRSLREWVSELPEGHPERAARESMHAKGLDDLKYMWDRNAGRMSVEPTDMLGFAVKTLMNGAYIRIAGGIWKAAVQDIGTAIFTNPRFVKQVLTHARAYSKLLKEIDARALDDADGRLEGLRQLKVLMASMENSAHTGVSPRAMGRGSALDQFGIGDGVTRDMTRALEVGMQNVGDKTTWLTGLNLVGDFTRHNAAFAHIADMAHFSKKPWGTLSAARRAQLASMNIGAAEHKRIGELMSKHGKKHGKLFDPGIDKWDDPRMLEVFEVSIVKSQNRSAYTDSIGAVPISLHDGSVYVKALQQFQSHAYMTLQFFIKSAVQRGAVTGDYYSGMAALATMLSMATLMSMLRAYENGKLDEKLDDWEKNPSTLARELVDRSGVMGAASPYFDMATKTGLGTHLNKMLGTKFFDPGTKFSQNNALASLVGPAFGQAQAIYAGIQNTVNGDLDKASQKFLRLMPFNQQIRLFTEIENSFNE